MRLTKMTVLSLALFATMCAADQFEGMWKLNLAKSTPSQAAAPERAIIEQTSHIEETAEQNTVTVKGTRKDGSTISQKFTVAPQGGPIHYLEGAPPAGVSVISKRINDTTVDFSFERDGKEIQTQHNEIIDGGKTMRITFTGTDAQGKPVHNVTVWDRQ